MELHSKIYVAGHRGLVGSALVRTLTRQGYSNLLLRTHTELDLCNQAAVQQFFASERPAYVFVAAARVGGILANSRDQAGFLLENLQITCNMLEAAYQSGVEKLLFLGSSCVYPRQAPQPIPEEALLTGALEPTNEGYAIAKIAGLKLCEYYNCQQGAAFISVMPCNLYGPNDNFDAEGSHLIPALLRRFHAAKQQGAAQATLWGSGNPLREFLYVDDLADACLMLMAQYTGAKTVNIGSGKELSVLQTAQMAAAAVGYAGAIAFDHEKPDGTPRKLLDSSRMRAMGWRPKTDLASGLRLAYEWYRANATEGKDKL
ncbi:MAG: GDP-L-fucose synthase [Oscillospiraceae bacterium]|jgi:GDP-L-fucose synthase|nr:GDP-L-fucose synthase [Oscillospiraceae bacterium]